MPRVLEFTETITFFTGQYEKSLAVIFLCLYVCYPGEEQHMFHRRATTLDYFAQNMAKRSHMRVITLSGWLGTKEEGQALKRVDGLEGMRKMRIVERETHK